MTPAPLWIDGRPFTLGTAYLPARELGTDRRPRAPRRLLGHDPAFPWVGGRVLVGRLERTRVVRVDMSGRAWAAWARTTTEECAMPERQQETDRG